MNAEQLHDAISLLPGDLVAEADNRRTAPKPVIPWKRYAAMAACLALFLGVGIRFIGQLATGGTKKEAAVLQGAPKEDAYISEGCAPEELPAMAEEERAQISSDSPGTVSAQGIPSAAASGQSSDSACQGSEIPQVMVSGDFDPRELTSEERQALAQLLSQLTYLPEDVCECIAEITVTVNGEDKFFINLDEGFVRCSQGQATLTPEQIDSLREIFYPEG